MNVLAKRIKSVMSWNRGGLFFPLGTHVRFSLILLLYVLVYKQRIQAGIKLLLGWNMSVSAGRGQTVITINGREISPCVTNAMDGTKDFSKGSGASSRRM
ncbi:hypothetical protein FRB95_002161 [Tulasnella sp. JGI-2019a]|nr:hypothetical protein FRB95_002161 [Tulasnella sp. JGI-2019a]